MMHACAVYELRSTAYCVSHRNTSAGNDVEATGMKRLMDWGSKGGLDNGVIAKQPPLTPLTSLAHSPAGMPPPPSSSDSSGSGPTGISFSSPVTAAAAGEGFLSVGPRRVPDDACAAAAAAASAASLRR
eukprot:CAMPEP_0170171830 /NCGR_PEP_ID=MMETSP0040_2-20121228/5032_1 /TAXON_ID=641309 /ORGANISM="Lotharella oceanica, Strain CCMP622" /LENGTH=128 /DNA_ID=CAMNT_0010412133 /DNA_START=35 /DNA_END=421 /DNA_ORIENTATION=+